MKKVTKQCIERLKSCNERSKKFGKYDKIVYDKRLFLWQYVLYYTPIFTLRYYREGGFSDGLDCTINDGGYNSRITNERLRALIHAFDLPISRYDGKFWVGDEMLKPSPLNKHIERVRIQRYSPTVNMTQISDEINDVTKQEGKIKYIITGNRIFERIN